MSDPWHPYGHDREEPPDWRRGAALIREALNNEPLIRQGLPPSVVSRNSVSPGKKYLYSITNVDYLLSAMTSDGSTMPSIEPVRPETGPIIFRAPGRKAKSADKVFNALRDATDEADTWLKLRDHMNGHLRTRRSATWWTTRAPSPRTCFEDRLVAGMCFPLIRPIVLRLDVVELQKYLLAEPDRPSGTPPTRSSTFLVPAEIDAFEYPVFDVQPDAPAAPCGRTIDLSEFPNLKPGCDEYVIYNVPVSCVSAKAGFLQAEPPNLPDHKAVVRNLVNNQRPPFWAALCLYP